MGLFGNKIRGEDQCVSCGGRYDYICPNCGAKTCMICMQKAKQKVERSMSKSSNAMFSFVGKAGMLGYTCPSCLKGESDINRWGKRTN